MAPWITTSRPAPNSAGFTTVDGPRNRSRLLFLATVLGIGSLSGHLEPDYGVRYGR
jgi:hypothetical protein